MDAFFENTKYLPGYVSTYILGMYVHTYIMIMDCTCLHQIYAFLFHNARFLRRLSSVVCDPSVSVVSSTQY